MGLHSRGFIIGRIFASEIRGAFFSGGLIGILRYLACHISALNLLGSFGIVSSNVSTQQTFVLSETKLKKQCV